MKSSQPRSAAVGTGKSGTLFTVFTYFGHHHQDAEGRWEAKGAGVFRNVVRASRISMLRSP